MITTTPPPNPFIGPRSFETGEKLFGRDREVRDLLHLLIAERIVLLHSPSGAGKSSLIKAALIPALERKDFTVLPPVRVSRSLPPGAPPEANRYVYSTLLSLEERFAPGQRLSPGALAGLCLADYLQGRLLPPVRAAERDPLLIFDQFEELLTADPADLAAKRAFFAQLGQALGDRRLWALFAMREDYLAALDPYLAPIPGRFKDTFRLDLLGAEAARQAMQGPAKAAGVVFSAEAAARLADDLRRTRVQRPDGTYEEVRGPYVEPVQLQVVCLRLWERRFAPGAPARKPVITPEDISDVGDVDSALAGYYEERVRAVAAATGVRERAIRDWFDDKLITPQGQRSQVMREPQQSAGLDNRAIPALIDTHLVRADERQGTVWYELAHDRLVAPVRQNNAEWRRRTLTPFQRQAELWEDQSRGEGLLLQGQALCEAERWAEANRAELTEAERAFLEACQKARAVRQQQERANRRTRQALVGAVLAALAALGLAGIAFVQQREAVQQRKESVEAKQEAERQARMSLFRAVAAQSLDSRAQYPQRSLLLAVMTQQIDVSDDLRQSVGLNTLVQGLQRVSGRSLRGHTGPVMALAFSPDGRTLATGSNDGTVRLWPLDDPSAAPAVLCGPAFEVTALAFSPDGRTLASAGSDGALRLWRPDRLEAPPAVLRGHTKAVTALVFSPDGRSLASASEDSTARLWRLDNPRVPPAVLREHTGRINALVFSPDGSSLASASEDGSVRLWDPSAPAASRATLSGHRGAVQALAFSPDGRSLASAGADSSIRLWDPEAPAAPVATLSGHTDQVRALAFSPDGRSLASAGYDTTVRLWDPAAPAAPPRVLRGHENWISRLAFSPDGRTLASSSYDKTIRLWSLDDPTLLPRILYGHEGSIRALAFSPDGRSLASASWDTTAHLWEAGSPDTLLAHTDRVLGLAFSPDGRSLAGASRDGTLRLWRTDTPGAAAVLGGQEGATRTLAFSPDRRSLATASVSGSVRLWQLDTPGSPSVSLGARAQGSSALAFSPDGRTLASANLSGTIQLWQVRAPRITVAALSRREQGITALAFSPDGRSLATGTASGVVRLWDLRAPRITVTTLAGHTQAITALAFSPDGRSLASASADTTARLWPADGSDSPVRVLRGHAEIVTALAFSPDGHTLATGSADATARLWPLDAAGAPASVLRGHDYTVTALAFSSDGRTLISGSAEGTARVWRVPAREAGRDGAAVPPIVLSGHADTITALALSPDGRTLATGSWDATARLWSLDNAALVHSACTMAGRNLSLDEWRQLDTRKLYTKTCLWLPRHPTVYQDLLSHRRFDLALMAYQEDRSLDPLMERPAAWLTAQAVLASKDAPVESVLAYLLARWRDPLLHDVHPLDLAKLCRVGADSVPTPALLDACDRALASDPGDLTTLYAQGRLRARLGDRTGALRDLQKAQRLAQERQQLVKEVQRWLSSLQAGQDPLASAAR